MARSHRTSSMPVIMAERVVAARDPNGVKDQRQTRSLMGIVRRRIQLGEPPSSGAIMDDGKSVIGCPMNCLRRANWTC